MQYALYLTHLKPLSENLYVLNVYQINTYQHLNVIQKFINNVIPSIFSDLIKSLDSKYHTNFSESNYFLKIYFLNSTKFSSSIHRTKLWNDVIKPEERY